MLVNTQGFSQTTYIQNGSFEEHRTGQYPNGRTFLTWSALELMKCLITNLPNGLYYFNIIINNKIINKPVMIIK